jgi:hypothetical protein
LREVYDTIAQMRKYWLAQRRKDAKTQRRRLEMMPVTPPSITPALLDLIPGRFANFGLDQSPCLGALPAAIDLPVFPGIAVLRIQLLRAKRTLIFGMSCHARIILKPH